MKRNHPVSLLIIVSLLISLLISPAPAYAAVTYTTCPDFTTFAADVASDGIITFNLAADCDITFTSAISVTSTVSISNLAYGTHAVTFNAPAGARHFTVNPSGDLSLVGLTLTNNNPSGYAGGITNSGTLTVISSTLSGNSADYGGGIINTGPLTVTSSTLSGNTAGGNGGGIDNSGTLTMTSSTLSGNTAGFSGGGIYNHGGTLSMTSSTLNGNRSNYGGGIENGYGTLSMTNSTLSGNSAAYNGGGIYNWGTLTVTSSTLSGNSPRGIYNENNEYTNLNVADSIFANSSTGFNCSGSGPISPSGANFADDDTCPGFTNSANLLLQTLADNGGPTQTVALGAGSDAIDAATTSTLNRDQRGYVRPAGAANDSGAYEFGAFPPPPVTCAVDSHSDGRLNAADGCAPIAVYADGAGGLEVYATEGGDYHRGNLLTSAPAAAISAALAGVTEPTTQELITSGGGVAVYALPGSWIKVEIAGAYGFEFPVALLVDVSAISAPLVLPATLPQTGGAMRNNGGWITLLALVAGAGAAVALRKK